MKATTHNKIGYVIAALLSPLLQQGAHISRWFMDQVYEMRVTVRSLEKYYQEVQTKTKALEKKEEMREKLFGDD